PRAARHGLRDEHMAARLAADFLALQISGRPELFVAFGTRDQNCFRHGTLSGFGPGLLGITYGNSRIGGETGISQEARLKEAATWLPMERNPAYWPPWPHTTSATIWGRSCAKSAPSCPRLMCWLLTTIRSMELGNLQMNLQRPILKFTCSTGLANSA